MNLRLLHKLAACGLLAAGLLTTRQLNAQELTLEGQTGGFLTPTAYVVYSDKDHKLSHPAVGFHFIDAASVIGNIETFSIAEGYANRAEAGYTRSVHELGNNTTGLNLSRLWNYSGMNIFSAKVVGIKDGQFGPWTPGLAVGGLVRTQDYFVSSAVDKLYLGGSGSAHTNGDVYVAVTKTWLHPPAPFFVNFGWKATNATIFGIGGQSTRFGGRFFGGLGIPLPFFFKTAVVPSAGFTQEPKTAVNLNALLFNPPLYQTHGQAHLPTTLDYAVRITQAEKPHFSIDIGIGQVAGNIGATLVPTGLPAPHNYEPMAVNLQARHVVGVGLSYRY